MCYSRTEIAMRELILIGSIALLGTNDVRAQIPGFPLPVPQGNNGQQTPKKSVASAEGPITVKERVSDHTIQNFLTKFLPKYPGVRHVTVGVDEGVVNIDGRVDDNESRDEVTDVVKRVEGVRVVMNQMKTDEEVMTAWQFAAKEAGGLFQYLSRKWLLIVVALAIVVLFMSLARLFGAMPRRCWLPLSITRCFGRWPGR